MQAILPLPNDVKRVELIVFILFPAALIQLYRLAQPVMKLSGPIPEHAVS